MRALFSIIFLFMTWCQGQSVTGWHNWIKSKITAPPAPNNAFVFNVNTDTMRLPLNNAGTYDFIVSWGDGDVDTVTSWDDADKHHGYSSVGDYEIWISGTCHNWWFNQDAFVGYVTSITSWGSGTLRLGNFRNYFTSAANLTSVVTDDTLDTTGMDDFWNMFFGCINLTTVEMPGLQTGNIQVMWNMFNNTAISTIDLSTWNLSSVTDFTGMFSGCDNLVTANLTNFSSGANAELQHMFRYCTSITDVNADGINFIGSDMSDVRIISYMFGGCTSLDSVDFSGWTTSSELEIAQAVFEDCNALDGKCVRIWDLDLTNVYYLYDTFKDVIVTTECYDSLLINLAADNTNNYCVVSPTGILQIDAMFTPGGSAETARTALINRCWTINDIGATRLDIALNHLLY